MPPSPSHWQMLEPFAPADVGGHRTAHRQAVPNLARVQYEAQFTGAVSGVTYTASVLGNVATADLTQVTSGGQPAYTFTVRGGPAAGRLDHPALQASLSVDVSKAWVLSTPTVVSVSASSVLLRWRLLAVEQASDTALYEVRFVVQASIDGFSLRGLNDTRPMDPLVVATNPALGQVFTFNATGLENGRAYSFRVTGATPYGLLTSNLTTALPVDAPQSVQELHIAAADTTTVLLHWAPPPGLPGAQVFDREFDREFDRSMRLTARLATRLTTHSFERWFDHSFERSFSPLIARRFERWFERSNRPLV